MAGLSALRCVLLPVRSVSLFLGTGHISTVDFTGALTNLDGVNSLNGLMNQDGTPTSLGWMYISDNYNN